MIKKIAEEIVEKLLRLRKSMILTPVLRTSKLAQKCPGPRRRDHARMGRRDCTARNGAKRTILWGA